MALFDSSMDKTIRFYITERCNASCPSCFNASFREQADMAVDKYEILCKYFKENGVTLLKIMGGEPTIHPEFLSLYKIAQDFFNKVCLCTNGLSPTILHVTPRISDTIIFNGDFIDNIPLKNLVLEKPGIRGIELQVRADSNVNIIKRIEKKLGRNIDKVIINFTLDCRSNIFKQKDTVIDKYVSLWDYCKASGIRVAQDHVIPICFTVGTKMPRTNIFSLCDKDRAGVVDSNYNLRYCNQFPKVLTNMFYGQSLIPYEVFKNHIVAEYMRNQTKLLDKLCVDCTLYNEYCNGGCFAGMDNIKRDDILNNTNFPII